MTEEIKSSVNTGSDNGSANGTDAGKPGEVSNNEKKQETVPKEQYDELFTKLGENSEELGSLRKLFEETSPLLEKLNSSPDLVKAIMDDKLTDENLIKAVLEGTVSTSEAKKVEKAAEEVKAELGKKEYEKASPELISKMIEEKIGSVTKEFEKTISSLKDERELEKYEQRIQDFIDSHEDFPEYATEINKYMDEHSILDVSIAYDAVVGKALKEKIEKENEAKAKEEAKNVASNVNGGGSSMRGKVIEDKNLVDQLIAGSRR